MAEIIWTDKDGRLCFSMSGPCTPDQVELVQKVGESLGLPGYFDALCGWWRGPAGVLDVPTLQAIVCAYEMGKRDACGVTAAPAQTFPHEPPMKDSP